MFRMNGIGNMIQNGLIESKYAYVGAGVGPIMFWEHLESWILYYRETRNIPDYMSGFEYYAGEVVNIRKQKGYPSSWSHIEQTFKQ